MDEQLKQFIAKTGRSKIAVIIPLYGYWNDVKDNPLNVDTLKITMDRVKSMNHNLLVFFVAEAGRISKKVQNYILGYSQGGNSSGVDVPQGSSYAEYINEGLRVAHDTSDCAYFVVLNAWNVIQYKGIDVMVDRLNYSDGVKIVSGYDLGKATDAENFDLQAFEDYFLDMPKEERELNCNFFGITRYALEMLNPDENIKTSKYFERDTWQTMYAKGFEVINSQRLPMFVFDVQLEAIENPADVELDKQHFQKKWGFLPTI